MSSPSFSAKASEETVIAGLESHSHSKLQCEGLRRTCDSRARKSCSFQVVGPLGAVGSLFDL